MSARIEMALPNKITPEWIYTPNTKGPRSETRGPKMGVQGETDVFHLFGLG